MYPNIVMWPHGSLHVYCFLKSQYCSTAQPSILAALKFSVLAILPHLDMLDAFNLYVIRPYIVENDNSVALVIGKDVQNANCYLKFLAYSINVLVSGSIVINVLSSVITMPHIKEILRFT